MRTERFSSLEHLRALRAEWTELLDRSAAATTFQRPEWILPWTEAFGAGPLHGIAVRDGQTLVGLALLSPKEPSRELMFVGAGNSDYLDAIVDRDCADEVGARIADAIGSIDGWTTAVFEQLRPAASFRDVPAPAGCTDTLDVQERCPAVMLPADVDLFYDRLSPGFLRRLRYARRRAARLGVRVADGAQAELDRHVDVLALLHERRWRTRHQAGVLQDPRSRAFLRRVAEELAASGRFLLPVLYVNGRPAAALAAFRDRQTIRFYIGGFDPALGHLSPGALLLCRVIEDAIRDGMTEFDFMRGAEPYKYEWGAEDRLNCRRTFRRAARSAAA